MIQVKTTLYFLSCKNNPSACGKAIHDSDTIGTCSIYIYIIYIVIVSGAQCVQSLFGVQARRACLPASLPHQSSFCLEMNQQKGPAIEALQTRPVIYKIYPTLSLRQTCVLPVVYTCTYSLINKEGSHISLWKIEEIKPMPAQKHMIRTIQADEINLADTSYEIKNFSSAFKPFRYAKCVT